MKFSIDPKIFEKFPGVAIGVLAITGMDNRGHNEEILRLLREEERLQKEKLTGVEMGSLPEVSIWRKIYQEFGSDPRDYRSSVEALLKRARGGSKPLPQINNLVDIYNYISLKYHLPFGAEDLDKLEGNIELGFAQGHEKGIYLGSDVEDTCYQGEVIYKDIVGFICRRWNWREGERTKIEPETKNAVLVVEKAPGLDADNFKSALDDTVMLISKYLSGKIQKFILDHKNNYFEIDFQTGTKTKELPQKK